MVFRAGFQTHVDDDLGIKCVMPETGEVIARAKSQPIIAGGRRPVGEQSGDPAIGIGRAAGQFAPPSGPAASNVTTMPSAGLPRAVSRTWVLTPLIVFPTAVA